MNWIVATDIAAWSLHLYFTNCAIVAWAQRVAHEYVSNLIPVSLPIYASLDTDLTTRRYSKVLWTKFHKIFQQSELSYTLDPYNWWYQHVMKSRKPVKYVKENFRHIDASYLASRSFISIISAANWLFTNAAWSDNWRCKPPVPSSPSQLSGLVKFVRTNA